MKPNLLKQAAVIDNRPPGQERKIVPVCFFCNEVPEEGIRSGFFLRGIFVCRECETRLINTKAEERAEYMLAISKLRQILFKK